MRDLLFKKLENSDIFTNDELQELYEIINWLQRDYVEALYNRNDVDEILDSFLYGYHQLIFTPDSEMEAEKEKYKKDYENFFSKYGDFVVCQQSILTLYKPISVEYRHYFTFTDGFYIGGITNLTPIPKSKEKEVIKELLRVLLKNKTFRYKNFDMWEVFYQIKLTPEELMELCR